MKSLSLLILATTFTFGLLSSSSAAVANDFDDMISIKSSDGAANDECTLKAGQKYDLTNPTDQTVIVKFCFIEAPPRKMILPGGATDTFVPPGGPFVGSTLTIKVCSKDGKLLDSKDFTIVN